MRGYNTYPLFLHHHSHKPHIWEVFPITVMGVENCLTVSDVAEQLEQQLEEARRSMYQAADTYGSYTHPVVLQLSKEVDTLVMAVMRISAQGKPGIDSSVWKALEQDSATA